MEVDIFLFTWQFQGQVNFLPAGWETSTVGDKCVLGAEIFIVQRQAIGECLSMMKLNLPTQLSVNGRSLWLFLKGNGNSKGCDISIFLKSVDAKDFDHHKKVRVYCSINLKDQINGGCKEQSCKANIVFGFQLPHRLG
ncbi:hypothetical protein H5410_037947, partial [Solanum commersonii]